MTYMLDVNSLLALGVFDHEFHTRVAAWVVRLSAKGKPQLATCSITELGFVRVLGHSQHYGVSITQARELLLQLKRSEKVVWIFIQDDLDISRLPSWVKTPRQTTDGHLLELAKTHKAAFATLDRGIPGAYVIPLHS
ncbi:MAG TPA: PIN domain-containing protein [Candidatus Acidoferrales bacterium]|jgi:predicted nucleic acid-binding protein|nr:PIN domain-containing protein [Candidatus Acidoferrales bacterium]